MMTKGMMTKGMMAKDGFCSMQLPIFLQTTVQEICP